MGHLACKCSHMGGAAVTQSQQIAAINTQPTSCAGPILLQATNPYFH